jgi:hypothetical protein
MVWKGMNRASAMPQARAKSGVTNLSFTCYLIVLVKRNFSGRNTKQTCASGVPKSEYSRYGDSLSGR